jgi:hypothetical protein
MARDIVKIVTSHEVPRVRAEIYRRDDGGFDIQVSRWHHEVDPEYGRAIEPFWLPVRDRKTICATLEIAEREAMEKLKGFEPNL